jgi:chaperonin GroEL (HSP60 family)
VTLLYASRILAGLKAENNDQTVASQIVRRAIQAPARKIAENAGVEGSIVVGKLTKQTDPNSWICLVAVWRDPPPRLRSDWIGREGEGRQGENLREQGQSTGKEDMPTLVLPRSRATQSPPRS